MKTTLLLVLFLVSSIVFLVSCRDTSYPCPAYSETNDKNATTKVGPDGTPINSTNRSFDENGLIKKKKAKRLNK